MKIVFWGTGHMAERTLGMDLLKTIPNDMQILGFADNDKEKWGGKIGKYNIFSPYQIKEMEFEYIIILSDEHYEEIRDMLIYWFHIASSKICNRLFLFKLLLKLKVIEKYRGTEDKEIQDILKYLETNELSIYNQYVQMGREINEVYWDKIENLPYIIFEDKKLYFPYDFEFQEVEGKKVFMDLMCEQQPSSPHRYIKGNVKVDRGDVIADVGVCEGNFALRYVEEASKIYLFESESRWMRPLEKTFEMFREKVVLCNSFVGRGVAGNQTSLDAVIKGRLDFLKMDIEGAEVDALIGGRETLMNNSVKCSICSYHRMNDELVISDLLKAYGYKTTYSDGYMFFWYDRDIAKCPEFRRGLVYGIKSDT